jgi:hypothetical protein
MEKNVSVVENVKEHSCVWIMYSETERKIEAAAVVTMLPMIEQFENSGRIYSGSCAGIVIMPQSMGKNARIGDKDA